MRGGWAQRVSAVRQRARFPQNAAAGSGTLSDDKLLLDVTINEGYTASGIAVKGANDTYVYDGPFVGPVTIEDMRAPPNQPGNTPQISHWFVCGMETPPTTPPTTAPPTTPPTTAPPTTAPATTAPPTSGPPTTPPSETTPPVVPPPPSLPTTGTRTGLMIGSAIAMIGSGVLLSLLVRQRRRFEV